MENAVARVRFEGVEDEEEGAREGELSDGDEQEWKLARQLVAQQNRKGKKSGGFQSMGLSLPVFKGIMRKGYRVPTPIQRKCIPIILDGKDVVAMARTGSGKTAAFLVPMFERLKSHSAKIGVRALILSPTRELATQTVKFTKELGKFTDLRTALLLGGDKIEEQFARIHENPDIIIATPGRLLHLLVEMNLKLACVEYVVLDEADRLFEMGFSEQLREILYSLPEGRQTLLFSATLPKLLVQFAKAGLHDPVLIRLDVDSKLSEQLSLAFLAARSEVKPSVLLHLLKTMIPSSQQTVVFAATRHHVEYLRELLLAAGLSVTYVYSSLDQTARKINIAKFQGKKATVMVVTDVAARGIDIPMLDNVINYNFPDKPKLFVHRVGRVARAGRSGCAYSLISRDELPYLIDLHLFISRPVKLAKPDMSEEATEVFGSVPQFIMDEAEEEIRQLHNENSDLPSLLLVAQRAQGQFVNSRTSASPESLKRAKQLPSSLDTHPLFKSSCSTNEVEMLSWLQHLHGYRPPATILEVHSTSRTAGKTVMTKKRQYHDGVVSAQKQKIVQEKSQKKQVSSTQPAVLEDDLSAFQTTTRKSKVKDEDSYIPHVPSDFHSEKGLSVRSSFESEAVSAILDLEGDDGDSFQRSRKHLKWDRKRKRFVGETGREANLKKIKTESGRTIPSSYRTDTYKRWKEKHCIETSLAGEEVEEEEGGRGNSVYEGIASNPRYRGKGRRRGRGGDGRPMEGEGRDVGRRGRGGDGGGEREGRRRRGRGGEREGRRGRGGERGGGGKRRTVGDLKTKEDILKKRRKKTFQQSRRRLKMKGKANSGQRAGSRKG